MKSGVNLAVLLAAAGIIILMSNVTAEESADTPSTTTVPGVVPIGDCSNMILYMADCLPFVRKGSTEKEPKGSCCDGLNTVIKSGGDGGGFCVCEIFESSAQIGDGINFTKVITLPSVCYLSHSAHTINCPSLPMALSPSSSAPAPAAVGIVSAAPGGSDINYINAPVQPHHPIINTSLGSSSSSTLALILSVGLLFFVAVVVSPFSLL